MLSNTVSGDSHQSVHKILASDNLGDRQRDWMYRFPLSSY